MKIALGSDHRGRNVKAEVISLLKASQIPFYDFGSYNEDPVDYPDIARLIGEVVASGEYQRGILACGTGIGVCIAANKIKGIRAATCYQVFCAKRARQHNDINVLCLGDGLAIDPLDDIVRAFLDTGFEGGRHKRRVDKIIQIEQQWFKN